MEEKFFSYSVGIFLLGGCYYAYSCAKRQLIEASLAQKKAAIDNERVSCLVLLDLIGLQARLQLLAEVMKLLPDRQEEILASPDLKALLPSLHDAK